MSINNRIEHLERKYGIRDQRECTCSLYDVPAITKDMTDKQAAQLYKETIKATGLQLKNPCPIHPPAKADNSIAMTADESAAVYREFMEATRVN